MPDAVPEIPTEAPPSPSPLHFGALPRPLTPSKESEGLRIISVNADELAIGPVGGSVSRASVTTVSAGDEERSVSWIG